MSRALSTRLTSEVAGVVTAPFFLIQIGWSPVSRLSTRGPVSYGGYTWAGGSASLHSLQGLPGGALQGQISLGNTDDAIGAVVLSTDLTAVPVTIWMLYGSEPFTAGDALQVFSGVIDGAELTPTRVTLDLVSEGRRNLTGPRVYCQPPLCNHMPPPGTRITWGGDTYVLNDNAPSLNGAARPTAVATSRSDRPRTYIRPPR